MLGFVGGRTVGESFGAGGRQIRRKQRRDVQWGPIVQPRGGKDPTHAGGMEMHAARTWRTEHGLFGSSREAVHYSFLKKMFLVWGEVVHKIKWNNNRTEKHKKRRGDWKYDE